MMQTIKREMKIQIEEKQSGGPTEAAALQINNKIIILIEYKKITLISLEL